MYYFFSDLNCALKINGKFMGTLSYNPISVNVLTNDFIEIIPPCELLPINFTINNPPNSVKILPTSLGNFIYPISFKSYPLGYKELFKKDFNNYKVSVLLDGSVKFRLYTNNGTFVQNIPFYPYNVSVFYQDNRHIGLLFNGDKQFLVIKEVSSGNTIFCKLANNFYLENDKIICEQTLPTVLNHKIIATFNNANYSKKISREKELSSIKNQTLFCLAFLECVSLKDELTDFLCEHLPSEKISDFIGEFDYILTSPTPSYQFVLIGKGVKWIRFTLDNNKISDITID